MFFFLGHILEVLFAQDEDGKRDADLVVGYSVQSSVRILLQRTSYQTHRRSTANDSSDLTIPEPWSLDDGEDDDSVPQRPDVAEHVHGSESDGSEAVIVSAQLVGPGELGGGGGGGGILADADSPPTATTLHSHSKLDRRNQYRQYCTQRTWPT